MVGRRNTSYLEISWLVWCLDSGFHVIKLYGRENGGSESGRERERERVLMDTVESSRNWNVCASTGTFIKYGGFRKWGYP